ncbi:serine/threonine protein kinase [Streptomyces verrucosisporus]|uniref:serine/threonine-protein kinase n=1 Tax=Streptomyces verrucosisporus TaxID=1695161 RepID=UPI0019D07469|nr:serine/threonine-protein kinase [Streptomyces verrucosisporus]MBN3929280.1 serine/threonine protein kinase [Streptomyces verrucosisporus]
MGEVFAGRYELVDPIGRGGVGAVWRTWDHRRRRYVAAKVLQQSDAHTLLRFVREQALRIDHPHVLAPSSWAADDDKVLFTMDLVRGGSLAHLIGDYGPLPPVYVCTLLDQLLSGLSAVHAEDVVHRDIKPANILLEATGTGRPHLRLSDFGISMRKGEPRLTEADYVVGTPGYFAPEQLMGAEPDFPADLYAVGLVALYLLAGRKPDSQALVEAYVHGVPPAPQDIPEPLWQVLGTLLHPDPEARFRTATGVRRALASAAEMLSADATAEQEAVEVFDQIGPLPPGFGPEGPENREDPQEARPPGDTGDPGEPGRGPRGGSGEGPRAEAFPVSDTGSFHLPPPVRAHPQEPPQAPPFPAPAPPAAPAHAPAQETTQTSPGAPAQPYAYPQPYSQPHLTGMPTQPTQQTQPYTTARPPAPAGPADAGHRAPAARRPGPPPKVAASLLVLALVLIAVGVWALTQAP